jgi:SAM-dependent methyltransferase
MTDKKTTTDDADYQLTMSRFDLDGLAETYSEKKDDQGWRNRREASLIDQALAGVAPGSAILDLPCGAGRIALKLARQGYRATAADASPNMVRVAGDSFRQQGLEDIDVSVRDVMDTGFDDNAFDAVICNRLLHHYRSSAVRADVLRELKRISLGPVIAFYFIRVPVSPLTWDLRNKITGKKPEDRIPVPRAEVEAEVRQAGLKIKHIFWVKPGISPQCYVLLEPLD